MPMFNKIRSQESLPGSSRFSEPQLKFYGVAHQGDSILDVELDRHLVDPRVKFDSTQPLDLVASGVKYADIKVQPTLEDVHSALQIVRMIDSNAQYRAAVEAAFTKPAETETKPAETETKPAETETKL